MTAYKPIIVHGGGKEISRWVEKVGMEPQFINGLRVTDISSYMGFEDPQAVYKWQSGKTLPSLGNMIALAKLFRTPIESIIVITGEERDSSPVVIRDELQIGAA